MKKSEIIAIVFILIIFGIGCFFSNKKEDPKIEYEVLDSNKIYDRVSEIYQEKQFKLLDSIDRLNNRVTATKTIFKYKYKEIVTDSLITDSNCLITLYYADVTIRQQDSIIEIQSRGLDACASQVDNLRNQVKLNENFAEFMRGEKELLVAENSKLKKKVKRNRNIGLIISGVLVGIIGFN